MFAALHAWLGRQMERWLFQLQDSEPGEVLLVMRRVFIVPTQAGMAYACLLLLMLIGALNYNLGLGFALTFFAAACGIADMWLTARNLALLALAPGHAAPVFAGQLAQFELQLLNRSARDRYAIWLAFQQEGAAALAADVCAASSTCITLSCASGARGWLAAPRVRLLTRFPLGLFRAWSYWQPDLRLLVYPWPEDDAPPLPLQGLASADGHAAAGDDHFAGIRSYQAGDPLRHLAWRQIARHDTALGRPLLSKQFDGAALAELRLDLAELPAQLGLERRLSRLTRWVLEAEQRSLPYTLRLGAVTLGPAFGPAQRAACLQALALYGSGPSP